MFNCKAVDSTRPATPFPFSLNLCASDAVVEDNLIPLLDLNHVSLSTVIKLLFDDTVPSKLVVPPNVDIPVTLRLLLIPTALLNVASPDALIRNLSVPSVVTINLPSDPVSITSADVLPSLILSLETVTLESMVPLNAP